MSTSVSAFVNWREDKGTLKACTIIFTLSKQQSCHISNDRKPDSRWVGDEGENGISHMMAPVLSFSQEQPLPQQSNPPALIPAGFGFHIAMQNKEGNRRGQSLRNLHSLRAVPHSPPNQQIGALLSQPAMVADNYCCINWCCPD